MRISQAGFTLTEAIVSVAILGLVSVSMVKVQNQVTKVSRDSQNTQILLSNSNRILSEIGFKLKSCGAGLRGLPDPATGKTVIAAPDNPFVSDFSDLIFLSQDNSPVGTLGVEDGWTRLTAGYAQGHAGLLERFYNTDNWNKIKNGTAPVTSSRFMPLDKGVSVSKFSFTLLDCQNPPRISNQDPNSTSTIRISIEFTLEDKTIQQEKLIVLENLLYGPS